MNGIEDIFVEDMDNCDDKMPRFLDLMSGDEFPAGKALQWCGWIGQSLDIKLDESHDMASADFEEDIERTLDSVDAVVCAFDCKTTTRIREKPIPTHKNPPPPLRDATHPWGRPVSEIGEVNAQRVATQNKVIRTASYMMERVHANGGAGVGETPKNAWLWALLDELKRVSGEDWQC